MIDAQSDPPTAWVRSHAASRFAGTRLIHSRFLSLKERDALEGAALPARSIGPNVDLVREGERADNLLIVADGWACRYMTTRNGARQFSALLLPGDVGTLDALMFDRLDYGVRTLTRVSVVMLPRDRAVALAAEHPGIARTFTWLALVENAILSRWSLSLGRKSAKERLAHLLCELSVRLGAGDGRTGELAIPLTQEQLADALGLTSVHINRTVRDLRDDGLLVTGSRIMTLPDVASLRRVGGFDAGYLHLAPPAESC